MLEKYRSSLVMSKINSKNCKNTVSIKPHHKKLGQLYVSTTCDEDDSKILTTILKNKCGKELGKENFLLKKVGFSYGVSIKTASEYRQKGYGIGEMLRLSSIIMILENKIKEFSIYSLPTAIFFHSKYKFVPAIEKDKERVASLNDVIKNCTNNENFKDIEKQAQELLYKIEKNNNPACEKELYAQTNELITKYIQRVLKKRGAYKEHSFKYGMNMKLTTKNILQNKHFFNSLFIKHKINYYI